MNTAPIDDVARAQVVSELRRQRSKSSLLRISLWFFALATAGAWGSGFFEVSAAFDGRRIDNLQRFLTQEVVPHHLRGTEFGPLDLGTWALDLFSTKGWGALLATLWLALSAIALATFGALVAAPFAVRTLAVLDPFLFGERGSSRAGRFARAGLVAVARGLLVAARAVPEYVLAFFLLAMLGPGAWPAVLALALHNAGILGRLGAEVVENLEPGPARGLAQLGASRGQILLWFAYPQALGRVLLYVFYRFETCVREATVLGLLGILSLGYWIQDARSRLYYDEMLFYVALGALLVLGADLVSALVRRAVRRA